MRPSIAAAALLVTARSGAAVLALVLAGPLVAGATTIDFEIQSTGYESSRLAARSSVADFVTHGVRFTALPAGCVTSPRLTVIEQCRFFFCQGTTCANHVLATGGSGDGFSIRADFPPGLPVTAVSVEVLAHFIGGVLLQVYDAQGELLGSAVTSVPIACTEPQLIRVVPARPPAYTIVGSAAGCNPCLPFACEPFVIDNFSFETGER